MQRILLNAQNALYDHGDVVVFVQPRPGQQPRAPNVS